MRFFSYLFLFLLSFPVIAQDNYHDILEDQLLANYDLEVESYVFNNTEVNNNNNIFIFGGAWKTEFDISGMDFSRVINVSNNTVGDPWSASMGLRNSNPINEGDAILLVFWGKRTSADSDLPIFIEHTTNFEKEFYQAISLEPQWQQYFIAFKASNNYGTNNLSFGFHLANTAQNFQLGGFTALNLGDDVDLADIPFSLSADTYGGWEADAPWRAEAATRIENLRKADLDVKVKDMNGNEIEGATVSVEMQEHDFSFGSAMVMCRFPGNDCFNQTYVSKIKNLDGQGNGFNAAVSENAMKWDGWEEEWLGSPDETVDAVAWLNNQGIDVRGHTLLWPGWDKMPDDILENQNDLNYIKDRINGHLETLLLHPELSQMVDEWDIINEITFVRDLENAFKNNPGYPTGRELYAEVFEKATELAPNNTNYLNDYVVLSGGGSNEQTVNRYKSYIQEIIDSGAKFDGIGFQAHIGASPTSILKVKDVFDEFYNEYGKRIKVTEYDIVGEVSPDVQARYLNDFLTMVFSHEALDAFIMWGFWDGNHWKENAPMFDINWNLKPSGEAFNNLVFNEWWTDESSNTNDDGIAAFRPFKGEHKITVEYDGDIQEFDANITSDMTLNVTFGATSTNDLDPSLVSITPNPAKNFIQVNLDNHLENVDLEISDITGKICKSFSKITTNTQLELEIDSGVYTVKIKNQNRVGYQKLVVQ